MAKSSISSYQRIVYKHIIPNIGENKVDDVENNKKALLEKLGKYSDATKSGILVIFNSIMRYNPSEASDSKKLVSNLEEKEIPIRYVPIPTKLLRVLLSRKGRLNDYVISGNSKQVEPRTAQNRLTALCKKTGLCTKVTYNRLRDYFAVNAIVNNVNPIVVTDILGVEFDMIKKYLNTAKERIDM